MRVHDERNVILQRCIARCTRSRDGRGRWRAERDCTAELGGRQIDADCAAAARRIGEWLAGVSRYPEHACIGRAIAPEGIAHRGTPIRATADGLPPAGGRASQHGRAAAPSATG